MKRFLAVVLVLLLLLVMLGGCSETEGVSEEPGEEAQNEPEEMSEAPDEEDDGADLDSVGVMTEAGYIDMTPMEARELMDLLDDLVVIDVSPKYAEGHLPGAINYHFGDGSLEEAYPGLASRTWCIAMSTVLPLLGPRLS